MKKILTLIVPVLLLMYACNNNNPSPAAETQVDTTAAVVIDSTEDTTQAVVPSGATPLPAQVFDDLTTKPISGASVVATDANGRSSCTATTDEKGQYNCAGLSAGKTYTFVASKQGYKSQTKTAVYENQNGLPWFGMVVVK
ncbi:MAG: carboxypeptidase regulatory-like domain-containing protein [Bacteroidetes bacterium]|nr:carboxypeptidase regulatory-like domain-containing protein [Bacteroidota bacterium]MBK8658423.1 carboxypeptidase regulatory-like domain-containing protein [Bacteroidota bacterium]